MKKAKWFRDLQKTRKEFKNVENAIEGFRFKYDRENHLVEWVIGISIALLISLSIANILNHPKEWIRTIGIYAYVLSFTMVIIAIGLHLWANYRQKKAMGYLYREKDKQESKKNKKTN